MPNSKTIQRRGPEEAKSRRGGILAKRTSSFHGRGTPASQMMTPQPDLTSWNSVASSGLTSPEARPKPAKVLLNVTIQGSLSPVQVVMTPDSSVGDLAAAAVKQYVKEARRPFLPTADPSGYDLHYSRYTFECLDEEEKVMSLGSRNFFLCGKREAAASSSCCKEADKAPARMGLVPWPKFMDFLL